MMKKRLAIIGFALACVLALGAEYSPFRANRIELTARGNAATAKIASRTSGAVTIDNDLVTSGVATHAGLSVRGRTLVETYASPAIANGHQGYAWTGTHHLIIDTTALYKYDDAWNLVQSNEVALSGTTLLHMGDGNCANGKLYVCAEIYNGASSTNQSILVFNSDTLAREAVWDVSAQGFEISGVVAVPSLETIFAITFTGPTSIWKYSIANGSYQGVVSLDTPLTVVQGITYNLADGLFYLMQDSAGKIFTADLFGAVRPVHTIAGRAANFEGLEWVGDELRWLNDDPVATPRTRVFTMKWAPSSTSSIRSTDEGVAKIAGRLMVEDVGQAVNAINSPVQIIRQQQSAENNVAGGGYDGTGPSFGMVFRRLYTLGRETDLAGIFAYGSVGWQGGMAFYTRNLAGQYGKLDRLALNIRPDGVCAMPFGAVIGGAKDWGRLSAAPSTPGEGDHYWDLTLHKRRSWDGSAWQDHW